MGPKKVHISQLQDESPSITDLSQPHPNDMRTQSRRGGYGGGDYGTRGGPMRREDSRGVGGFGRSGGGDRYDHSEEADTAGSWRRTTTITERPPLRGPPLGSTMSRGDDGIRRRPGDANLRGSIDSTDRENWRGGPGVTESSPAFPSKRPNFRAVFAHTASQSSKTTSANVPATTPSQSPQKSEEPPVSSPPKSETEFSDRAASLLSVEAKPKPTIASSPPHDDGPWQRVESKLQRTREHVGGVSQPPASGITPKKKSLDLLHARPPAPTLAAAPSLVRTGLSQSKPSVDTRAVAPAEDEKVEKKRKKVNDKKAAIRAAAAAAKKAAEGKHIACKSELKGSRKDVAVITDKLEAIFEEDSAVAPKTILASVTASVEKRSTILESTLILACLVALCVREVIHHAEGPEEAGLPSDTPASALEELVAQRLLPEACESWKKVIPLLQELQPQVSYSEHFNYVLLSEIMRICSQSGCPRLSPTLTLTELMLLSFMQTSKDFVTPSLILEWVGNTDDETEGRGPALVQTANLVKWLKGGLLTDSADEASDSDND